MDARYNLAVFNCNGVFITVIILALSAIQPLITAFSYHDDIAKAGAIFAEVGSIMSLENGFETIVGTSGAHLSGGEKQRISIARAMMKNASIIILDEATANIDPENERDLMEAIKELTQKKTVIMIAHRLKTVRNADQIVVIDTGKIVCCLWVNYSL